MKITETKYVLEIELRPTETIETLDYELPEFYGMLFTCDNTQERAIMQRQGKRIAACGFLSKEYADEYLKHRAQVA